MPFFIRGDAMCVMRSLLALFVGASLLFLGCDGADDAARPSPTSRATTTSSSPDATANTFAVSSSSAPPATTPVAETGPLPADFVAVLEGGKVVLGDTMTGRTIKEVATGANRAGRLDRSPDGRTVYFTATANSRDVVRSVSAGGTVTDVVEGWAPAVSPDGQHLAYAILDSVRLLDLPTGAAHQWQKTFLPTIQTIAWMSDSQLAIGGYYEEGISEVYLLDLAALRQGERARLLKLPPEAEMAGWCSPSYRAYDGLLGMIEGCPQSGVASPNMFVVVDPATGVVKGRFTPKQTLQSAVYDGSGRHQLLLDYGGRLYRRSGGGLTPLGGGYWAANW